MYIGDMMNTTYQIGLAKQFGLARDVLTHNLTAACRELKEYDGTGVLCSDGFIRAAASHLTDEAFEHHAVSYVINMVRNLAVEYVLTH